MESREDEIAYCKSKGIDLPFDASHSYSRDRNLWHISHEGLELEDPAQAPNYDHMLVLSVTPEKAPDVETEVTMTFEKGMPTSVNGKKMKVADIIRTLNKMGGENGIGIVDIVENRVVGMKSRGVYETPGGTILLAAHKQLEELILDRATMEEKKNIGNKLAEVVYEGKWYTPLCQALIAFVKSTQEYMTGEVKFKLYKGNIIKAGTTSPYSLYNESLASFTTGDLYDHHDASGFITLFGLPLLVRSKKLLEVENNTKTE
jgi:argininosuccinate synthase